MLNREESVFELDGEAENTFNLKKMLVLDGTTAMFSFESINLYW